MKTILALMFCLAAPGRAAQDVVSLYGVTSSTAQDRALLAIAGSVEISTSSKTKSDPAIILNGRQRRITVSDAGRVNVATITPAGFFGPLTGAASLNLLKAGDTMTGGLTSSSWANFTSSVAAGAGFYGNGDTLTGVATSAQLTSTASALSAVILSTGVIQTSLNSVILSTGIIQADVNTRVLRAGDTMTGALATTDITISSSGVGANQSRMQFNSTSNNDWVIGKNPDSSVPGYFGIRDSNGYKLVVKQVTGLVGIGNTAPGTKLHVSSGVVYNDGTGAGMYTTGTSTASAFYGNGSALTGVIQSTATGNYLITVSSATALKTTPTTCTSQAATGVDAQGNAVGCYTPAGAGDVVLASTQTFTGENTFGGTTSTTTFSGWVDMGLVQVSGPATATHLTVSCPTGKKVLSCMGYCNGAAVLQTNNPTSAYACEAYCNSAVAGNNVYAICARVK